MDPITHILESPISGTAMVVLLLTIGIMLVTTGVLTMVAVLFRFQNYRTAERWGRLEAKWEPVLLEVLAGDRPSQDLASRVRKGEELYFVDFLYRYARRLRGPEAELLTILARPFLAPVVAGVRRGDTERRARAVQTLGVLDFDTHADAIREALKDPSPLVSMIAMRALARPEQAEHLDAMLACIHRFESWSPRFLSSTLATMGTSAAPSLRDTLADSALKTATRTLAADALRKLGDPDAADVAVAVLAEETDRDLHSSVLRLLRKVGRAEHLPAVRRQINSEDAVVRAQAVRTLGRLGQEADVASLREAVEDGSPWTVIHAMRGLREVGRDDILKRLSTSTHARADVAQQVLTEAV